MNCDYMYYDNIEEYYPRLKCRANGGNCLYSKKCLIQEKFIPIENEEWRNCYIMIETKQKNIPKDSYYVTTYRPNKKGLLSLYVVINDRVEKIATELTELNQNYIYLKEGIDGYQVSLVPFVTEKKVYNRKTKSE